MKTCPRCGRPTDDNLQYCPNCGYNFGGPTSPTPRPANSYGTGQSYPSDNAFDACGPEGKSRGVAALLAILIGSLGIHYFYLGKTSAGIITIILSLVTCGLWSILILIQGILMFCMTNEQFRQKYVLNTNSFPLF